MPGSVLASRTSHGQLASPTEAANCERNHSRSARSIWKSRSPRKPGTSTTALHHIQPSLSGGVNVTLNAKPSARSSKRAHSAVLPEVDIRYVVENDDKSAGSPCRRVILAA